MVGNLLVVHPDKLLAAQIEQILSPQGYKLVVVADMSDAAAHLTQARPDLLILSQEMAGTTADKAIPWLRSTPRTADLPILVIIPNRAVARTAALEAGADGYVLTPLDERELPAAVRVVLERAVRMRQAVRQPGRIITFFSAKGGVGTTSICVNAAASLSQRNKEARVVCVDLSLPLGSVGDLIGVESTETVATLSMLEAARLDQLTVNTALSTRVGLGFEALLGSRDLAEAQTVNPKQIEPIMRHLQSIADLILVDVGRTVSRISLPVLKMSHRIVVILATDSNSLRLNQVALNYFLSLGISPKRLVLLINRAVGREGLSGPEAEELLKLPIFATVPHERDRFTVAGNAGMPLVLKEPDCQAAIALKALAEHLMGG